MDQRSRKSLSRKGHGNAVYVYTKIAVRFKPNSQFILMAFFESFTFLDKFIGDH